MPLSGELTLLLSLSFQSRVVVAVMDLAPGGFFASGGRGGVWCWIANVGQKQNYLIIAQTNIHDDFSYYLRMHSLLRLLKPERRFVLWDQRRGVDEVTASPLPLFLWP